MPVTVSDDQIKIPNRVRWQGCGPPADGDFIARWDGTLTSVTLYTVPEGYELHIYNSWLYCRWSTGAGDAYLGLYDATPAQQYALEGTGNQANEGPGNSHHSRFAPAVVSENWTVRIWESGDAYAIGGFEGYLVKVL